MTTKRKTSATQRDFESEALVQGKDYDIQVSQDKGTVWIHAADGSCIGRFSKRAGLDVHKSASVVMEGGTECLYCTHRPAGKDDWETFCEQVMFHHRVPVPLDLLEWN